MRRLARAFAARQYDKYQNLVHGPIYFNRSHSLVQKKSAISEPFSLYFTHFYPHSFHCFNNRLNSITNADLEMYSLVGFHFISNTFKTLSVKFYDNGLRVDFIKSFGLFG